MEMIEAIKNRRSVRAFKSEPVQRSTIENILNDGLWAPSASNTQPWEILVLVGEVLTNYKRRLAKAIEAQPEFSRGNPDIPFPGWDEPYKSRSTNTGLQLRKNTKLPADLYGAPVALIIYTDKAICPKAILDVGLFSQTIALAALARGLGTCMMTYGVSHPNIIREMFNVAESKLIALCVALGYPEANAEINRFNREREPLSKLVKWYGI